jgi:hypothetical protein
LDSLDNTVTNLEIGSTIISFTSKDIALKNGTNPGNIPSGYQHIGKFVNATNTSADSWLYLNVSYTNSDIFGVNENSLFIARNNGTWEINTSMFTDGTYGVNTDEDYVYANITNFGSIFAPLGRDTIPPQITIITPENTTYNTQNNLQLNYTVTDNVAVDSCWYSLDNGDNISLPSCANTTFNVTSDGSHNIRIYANDTSSNENSTIVYFSVDSTPPTILEISVTNITTSSAIVNWLTNENANSSVNYGINLSLGSTQDNSSLDTSHNISLTNLSSSTLYYYNITSCDNFGNCNTTGPNNFTTLAVAAPPAAPTGPSGGGASLVEAGAIQKENYIDFELGVADSITYTANGEQHTITIKGIFDDIVEIQISSSVIKAKLKVGEPELFDTNGNGVVDLELTVLSKAANTVKLRIKPLIEMPLPPPKEEIEKPTVKVAVCGNGICEEGENSANCIADCPVTYTAAFFAGTSSLTNLIIVLLIVSIVYVVLREIKPKFKYKPKRKVKA